jgi:hypothetical protein
MHDYRMDSAEAKDANERNLIRCRTLVSEARTQVELKMARLMLAEQEEIAVSLTLEAPAGSDHLVHRAPEGSRRGHSPETSLAESYCIRPAGNHQ